MKIAFDVGGVLSKYPDVFRPLIEVLHFAGGGVEVYFISDMHPVVKIVDVLRLNTIPCLIHRVHSADYTTHGEECKAVLCEQLGIDILIDDFPGYLATVGKPLVRLLVMPDPTRDYYAQEWQTDGSEGNFGRRRCPMKDTPEADKKENNSEQYDPEDYMWM